MSGSAHRQDSDVQTLTLLSIDNLTPNDYNPNAMTTEEFSELVGEVRHLGRLPKPIVVRPASASRWEIVDGEHGWRAAREAGLTLIACEIIEADDFESMRQTYKRNQHGTHHPVRLGQMFRRMIAERVLSQRALAAAIGVSEGTIRNSVAYAEAADLRNRYAQEGKGALTIDCLSVRQVRAYVQFVAAAPAIGNLWIDCGADVPALIGAKSEQELETAAEAGATIEECLVAYARLEATGLVAYLPGQRATEFTILMKTLRRWAEWEASFCCHGLTRAMLRPYTEHHFRQEWVVRERFLMEQVLDLVVDPSTYPATFRLTPEELVAALHPPETFEAARAGDSASDGFARVQKAVLMKTGHLPSTRVSIRQELRRADIEAHAPAYLHESVLPVDIKYALWQVSEWGPIETAADPPISLEDAKRALAHQASLSVRKGESPNEVVQRHLCAYYDRAHLQQLHDRLTEQEMANTVARRVRGSDDEGDREAITVMAGTLLHLTKRELLALYAYTERADRWRAVQQVFAGLRSA